MHVCGRVHTYIYGVGSYMNIWVLCGMGVCVHIQSVGGRAIVKAKNELLGQASLF